MSRSSAVFFLGTMLLCCLGSMGPMSVLAQDDSTAEEQNPSWIEGLMQRFFGNKALSGEAIDGEGLEIVSPYLKYAGKTIEVVIVRSVRSFEEGWQEDETTASRLANALSSPFHDYTKEAIVRQYLLFEAGDEVNPFDLADSERMLRNLQYINDVRLTVVPLEGSENQVGIVVETNDRWPLGVTATVITKDRWRAKAFTTNLMGTGTYLSGQVLHNVDSRRDWGYRAELEKQNLLGSFWNAAFHHENSYRQKQTRAALSRPLIHPGLKRVGGLIWEDTDEYENGDKPRGYYRANAWVGHVFRLYDPRSDDGGARSVVVPAVRYQWREFYNRPTVSPDSSRGYHNSTLMMSSVTWQRFKSYKTSYLFGEGEVEDIPSGLSIKTTGVLEDREFEYRPGLFLDAGYGSVRHRGDVLFLGFSVGGFWENSRFEDGILDVDVTYMTPLWGQGDWRSRLYGSVRMTQGIGRHPFDKIYLDSRSGIYNLDGGLVAGNKRLVAKGLYRLFSPMSLWGFRMSFFGFGDLGVISGEHDQLLEKKFYTSLGVGVRLRNPGLVLPTIQLKTYMVTDAQGTGFRLGLNLGNVPSPNIRYPSTQPGTLAYE